VLSVGQHDDLVVGAQRQRGTLVGIQRDPVLRGLPDVGVQAITDRRLTTPTSGLDDRGEVGRRSWLNVACGRFEVDLGTLRD